MTLLNRFAYGSTERYLQAKLWNWLCWYKYFDGFYGWSARRQAQEVRYK